MAMVVVEARETGGTLDAGKECLRQNKPLLVINYHDATEMPKGNRMLLRSGGTPINTPRQLREYLQKVRLKQPQLSSVVQAQMPMLA
jgi:DNA processing protein